MEINLNTDSRARVAVWLRRRAADALGVRVMIDPRSLVVRTNGASLAYMARAIDVTAPSRAWDVMVADNRLAIHPA